MYLTFSSKVTREARKGWAVCFSIALRVHRVEEPQAKWLLESQGGCGTDGMIPPKGTPTSSGSRCSQ